jgi:O-antigen/teichoic acid export membrane protein
MSNTKTIARNTGWYGLESIISSVVGMATSIAIARTLGPSKMGYIIYVSWIASVVSSLGGMGVPATTQKYMAEFLGMGDRGTARYIYLRSRLPWRPSPRAAFCSGYSGTPMQTTNSRRP